MIEAHPEETELVQFAFADVHFEGAGDEVARHVDECGGCRGLVAMLRTQANALRLTAVPTGDATADCLDDEILAAFAAGEIDPADSTAAVTHLLDCARCSHEVASVARLLDGTNVKSEIERLGRRPVRHTVASQPRRLLRGLMVAAALIILLVPGSSQLSKRLYREESVTGATAPRLVAPVDIATPLDAFKWTSVPRADRYRITVFARDGSVIWEAQTRDTAIALPDRIVSAPNDTILWRVEAHVGWEDRWASSDLTMLTVRRAQR